MKTYWIVTGWVADYAMSLKEGTLCHDDFYTGFKSYEDARNALRRTKTYMRKSNFEWELHKCRIRKVEIDEVGRT